MWTGWGTTMVPVLPPNSRLGLLLGCLAALLLLSAGMSDVLGTLDLLMKDARPTKPEEYICTSYPVPSEKSFIYKFEALASADKVHHMLLYGCAGEPYQADGFWSCGPMCKGEQSILFAWAKNAPPTVLPKGVGFMIGANSTIKSWVLQVHYATAVEETEAADRSGIRIHTTKEEQPFVAGVFLLAAGDFSIPPGNSSFPVDVSCNFQEDYAMVPFAFRPHAHSLGRVITGYQFNGSYHLIGKGNPQWPQTFYPIEESLVVTKGDILAARCTYDSTDMSTAVSVGSEGKDEMCNLYIMFYTDKTVPNLSGVCVGDSVPDRTGIHFPSDVSQPLPPNPALEELAHSSHHQGVGNKVEAATAEVNETWTMDILMKGAKPNKPDAYLCAGYSLVEAEAFIYKFEALANAATVHHILVYGCDGEPFADLPIWECPAMCQPGVKSSIMFAWAKNAPPTVLPQDVGLRIGQNSTIKSIVLQVHYARQFQEDELPDKSGIRLHITHTKQPFVAGIYFMGAGFFSVPPNQKSYPVDISCKFSMQKSIFPFAFRPHAHGLGRVITGYQHNGTYHLIGKGNPQWPQAFYPVANKIEIKPGDFLAARCTYDSTSMTQAVTVGSTGNNEMCNFYMMFYTDGSVPDPSGECWNNQEPWLTGPNFPTDVSVPLPPNPELEEAAKGMHHGNHQGGTDSQTLENDSKMQNLVMKGAKPSKNEAYLCSAYPVLEAESYIWKFEAMADMSTVHHLLLYGCNGEPFSDQSIWECPQICNSTQSIIMYAWAKNAPPTQLPHGVGMRIGAQTQIKTMVLEVHYARSFSDQEPADYSGVRIYTTQEKQPYVAGIYLMASNNFVIPPGVSEYAVDISCKMNKLKSIFPFLFRTHAHNLGTVIAGYHYNGSYHEIGKGNPHWPQAFYPVQNKIEVKNGDYLVARCTYNSSTKNHTVSVGPHGDNEMCNMYYMFYTNSSESDLYGECLYDEAPHLTGSNLPKDASKPLPPNPLLEEAAHTGHQPLGSVSQNKDVNQQKLEPDSHWPSDKLAVGQIGGLATDQDGNVYIFHRGSRQWNGQSFSFDNDFMLQDSPIPEDVIVILDKQGKLVKKFGAGQYFMPHGMEVDHEGNLWLTDVALHQVFKIPHGQTTPSLTLGKRFQHGTDHNLFCKPTDVAVLKSGEFFVSDGYCNGRILKFSKDGTVLKTWGKPVDVSSTYPPPMGTFDIPHSVTVSEEHQLVCVADRENGRIQCFDLEGNFKQVIQQPDFGPRLFAIEQSPNLGGVLYAVNGPTFGGPSGVTVAGFTIDIKTGAVLEKWNTLQQLKNPHDICVDRNGQSVYVGELDPAVVWKMSRPASQQESVHVHITTQGPPASSSGRQDQITSKPQSFQPDNKTAVSLVAEPKEEDSDSDVTPAILIGCLLVVPVVLLLIIILVVRARHSGKLNCFDSSHKKVFSLQGILGNSHKGFDPLKTEESDRDSDQEEYLASRKVKNKA